MLYQPHNFRDSNRLQKNTCCTRFNIFDLFNIELNDLVNYLPRVNKLPSVITLQILPIRKLEICFKLIN